MNGHFCLYCGEPIAQAAESHSRVPGLCASCSSLADGMLETQRRTGESKPPEAPVEEEQACSPS